MGSVRNSVRFPPGLFARERLRVARPRLLIASGSLCNPLPCSRHLRCSTAHPSPAPAPAPTESVSVEQCLPATKPPSVRPNRNSQKCPGRAHSDRPLSSRAHTPSCSDRLPRKIARIVLPWSPSGSEPPSEFGGEGPGSRPGSRGRRQAGFHRGERGGGRSGAARGVSGARCRDCGSFHFSGAAC